MSKVKMHTEHTLHIQRHSEDTTYGAATLSTCRRATAGGALTESPSWTELPLLFAATAGRPMGLASCCRA